MGIVHAQRGRLAPAVILAVLMALAVIVTLGIVAGPASAQGTFTTCAAAGCHDQSSGDAFHQKTTHQGTSCSVCHTGGFGAANAGVTPASCAPCHGGTAGILTANATHTAAPQSCATTPGCHGVAPALVTTKLTVKVSPTSVKVRKSVKFSGTAVGPAGPDAALTGAKVTLKVERKVGTKWVKMKTGTATVKDTGAYAWSYKTAKKGTHRVTASIAAKANAYTAKKLAPKSFKVK